MKRVLLFLLTTALLLCFALTARGAFPAPEKLKKLLDSATVEKYPNADTVTVYDGEHVVYQRDGLCDYVEEFCIKALTEAGRKNLRSMKFGFNSAYTERSAEQALIVKPDGRRIAVDLKKHSSVAISSNPMGSNIFTPTSKVLSLEFPDLEPGDAVMATLKVKSIKTPFPGIYSDRFLLQSDDPVLLAEVTVDAPEALPLSSIAVKDPVEGTVNRRPDERKNGRIIYRWTAENVPQVLPEPNMPPISGVAQRLLVSTAADWKEISRWYCELCRPRLAAVDDAMKTEVVKLTEGKKTDAEKAMALFQFVSQTVRYTGVNNEEKAPGFEPHDVRDTFHQRHGVCRDKAALLTAMLNLAGLKAYMTLFHAGQPAIDAEAPASRFNHAVVAWETAPGKYQLMDPTFETTKEFFPAYMANQSYLVARPEGETLLRSPSPDAALNALVITTEAVFDAKGTLEGKSTLDFTGVNDQMYRSAFSRRSPDRMRQFFSGKLQKALPGAKLKTFKVFPENVRDMSTPLKVVLEYSVSGALEFGGAPAPLPLPDLSRHFGAAFFMANAIDLDTRRYPLLFDMTALTRNRFTVTLPEAVRLQPLPDPAGGEAPGLAWKRRLEFRDGKLHGESEIAVTQMEVSPQDYPALKKAFRAHAAEISALPLVMTRYAAIPGDKLVTAFPDADSFLEKDTTSVEIDDNGNTETIVDRRRRILNYAGVKRHSEIKVTYFPEYQDVEIRVVITSPDGKTHRFDTPAAVEMDAPWVAGAPRYSPARVKVAVLPGVQVGSLIESVVIVKSKRNGIFGMRLPLAGGTPTAERTIDLKFPRKLRIRLSPPLAGASFTTRDGGNFRVCKWRATNLPAIPDETMQPSVDVFVPTVFMSDGDYAEYAAQLDEELRKLTVMASPSVDLLLAGLRAPGDTPEKLALKIRDAVAKKLRHAGPEFDDLPFCRFSPPERTIADGYGNSADRAVVLGALLARAGIEYRFVAASDLPFLAEYTRMLKDYPQPVFDEILVYLPALDMYLNDTDQYAVPGSTAHASRIGLGLPDGALFAIRPRHKAGDETRTELEIRISPGGAADLYVTRFFYGMTFAAGNRQYSEMTPEERRQHFERLAAGFSPAARLVGTGEFNFSGYPGKIGFRCRIDRFATLTGNRLQFELPGYAALADALNVVDSERRTPALRNRSVRDILKYRIEFPDGFRTGRFRPAVTELGRRSSGYFSERFSVTRNRINLDASLSLPVEMIQVADYVELVNLDRGIRRPAACRIILTPVSNMEVR